MSGADSGRGRRSGLVAKDLLLVLILEGVPRGLGFLGEGLPGTEGHLGAVGLPVKKFLHRTGGRVIRFNLRGFNYFTFLRVIFSIIISDNNTCNSLFFKLFNYAFRFNYPLVFFFMNLFF